VYVDPKLGIVTSGWVPTIEEAKARFLASSQKGPVREPPVDFCRLRLK